MRERKKRWWEHTINLSTAPAVGVGRLVVFRKYVDAALRDMVI